MHVWLLSWVDGRELERAYRLLATNPDQVPLSAPQRVRRGLGSALAAAGVLLLAGDLAKGNSTDET